MTLCARWLGRFACRLPFGFSGSHWSIPQRFWQSLVKDKRCVPMSAHPKSAQSGDERKMNQKKEKQQKAPAASGTTSAAPPDPFLVSGFRQIGTTQGRRCRSTVHPWLG
jgi:hypothetical protein